MLEHKTCRAWKMLKRIILVPKFGPINSERRFQYKSVQKM